MFALVFNLVSLFVYAYICLFNLVLVSLCALKYVRLLVFFNFVSALFFCLLRSRLGSLSKACVCMHLACAHKLKYAYTCSWPTNTCFCPETLIQYSASFSLFPSHDMFLF